MVIRILAVIVGALILGGGLYYLVKEGQDQESRLIYRITSVIGGVIFVVALVMTILGAVG